MNTDYEISYSTKISEYKKVNQNDSLDYENKTTENEDTQEKYHKQKPNSKINYIFNKYTILANILILTVSIYIYLRFHPTIIYEILENHLYLRNIQKEILISLNKGLKQDLYIEQQQNELLNKYIKKHNIMKDILKEIDSNYKDIDRDTFKPEEKEGTQQI